MPKDREGFKDNMERLNEVFPTHDLLSIKDVTQFTGRSRDVVKRLFTFKSGYISKVELARALS